ncbi:hypothetical protein H4Q32_028534 [Labeo rohita]|uniref:Zinc finger BED domain-containing 1-like protein n=1 Tax=Labeo rohita TaxID=84645 RepID=A0ABQ8L8T1_LABRO|nr:hypothetical protein H4Q32_028534 [Labeo rohita]
MGTLLGNVLDTNGDVLRTFWERKISSGVQTEASSGTTSKVKVDKLMINLICEGPHPFSLVEQPAFRDLLLALNPQCKVISRPTLRNRIDGAANQLKKTLVSHLSKVTYVATTTDCWTAHQQSYIGVTAHWIDEETLERRSAALACQRLKGSHTFDVLAGALDDIHCQYRIRGKVVRTTTDSGSNFIKAFSVFGEQSQTEKAESESDQDSSEDPQAVYVDTLSILEQDSGLEYQLPPHQRCACHLLNLVATTDAAMAEKNNDTYKWLSRAALGKCQAMWNKSGWSYMAAEIVEDQCKLQLIRPNQTRWNSTYMAVERIIRIIQEKGEDAIRNVCEEFKVKMLSPAEIVFLTEYCTVMKPLVTALNILQSETNTHLGVAPAGGLSQSFCQFKTTWTERADIIEAGLVYVRQHLDQVAEAAVEQVGQHSSDEEDFFSSMESRRSQGTGELDGYLACVSNKMDLLNSFPHIKNLSVKLNTGLPASAACERLFSSAGLLFTAKRARMNSANFENQLLLKLNRKLIN